MKNIFSIFIDIHQQPEAQTQVEQLLYKALAVLQSHAPLPQAWQEKKLELTVRFSDDAEVQKLNKEFRGKDKPTNVLSFPSGEDMPLIGDGSVKYIGDIIVSCDTLAREAKAQEKTIDDHLSHLLVHSVLHLYGYDHIEEAEADEMESLEIDILAVLGVNNPYS